MSLSDVGVLISIILAVGSVLISVGVVTQKVRHLEKTVAAATESYTRAFDSIGKRELEHALVTGQQQEKVRRLEADVLAVRKRQHVTASRVGVVQAELAGVKGSLDTLAAMVADFRKENADLMRALLNKAGLGVAGGGGSGD